MTDLQLDTLESRGLIRVAQVQPELEYLFRHALLQDTAYESLLKQERRVLHQTVGETIEGLYPDRMAELAPVLAMHFEQAGDKDKAIQYCVAAARFASERNAVVEAYDLYGRARAMLPPRSEADTRAVRRLRVQIELGRATAGFGFMPPDEGLSALAPCVEDARIIGDQRLEAEVLLSIAFLQQFRGASISDDALNQTLARVARIGEELGDPFISALPESLLGLLRVFNGDIRSGIELLEKTAPQLEQKHDFVGSSFALMALGVGYARLGEFDKAEEASKRATDVAEHGDVIARLDSLIGLSMIRSMRGDLDAAVPIARQCTGMAEETGAIACVVASNFVLGDAYMRQGRFGEAKIALERSADVANTIEQRSFRPSLIAYLKSNAVSMGEPGSGVTSFDDALAETREIRDKWGEATVIWKRGETEARRDAHDRNVDQMLSDFATAYEAFEQMGARPIVARVLRDWGEALLMLNRGEEADEKLRAAHDLFEQLGISREAEESAALAARSVSGRG